MALENEMNQEIAAGIDAPKLRERISSLESAIAAETKRRQDAEAHAASLCESLARILRVSPSPSMARDEAGSALSVLPASCGDRLRKLEVVKEAAAAVLAERVRSDGARSFMNPKSDAKERLSAALSALDSLPCKE